MRFAGQRFRAEDGRIGKFKANDYAERDYRYRYQAAGLPQSRAAMPEVNVRSMAKTEQSPYVEPRYEEPEFRA